MSETRRKDTPADGPGSVDFGYQQVRGTRRPGACARSSTRSPTSTTDERPDVGRRAPALEALCARADRLRPGQSALDVAGGTGDLAAGMAGQVGEGGLVVLSDINAAMLEVGRDRLLDRGLMRNVRFSIGTRSACRSRTRASTA